MLSLSEMEGHKVLIACTKSQSTLDLYRAYWCTHSGALINLKDPSETGECFGQGKFTDMCDIRTAPSGPRVH